MLKLGLYKRKGVKGSRVDSYLLVFKPKDNMFISSIPRELSLDVGFSLCSKHDQFNKTIARQLANNRLTEKKFILNWATDRAAQYSYSDSNFNLIIDFNLDNGHIIDYDLSSVYLYAKQQEWDCDTW